MRCRNSVLLLFAGLCAAPLAFAGDTAAVKCQANQDLVWVYDSLNSFDVQAKLKCGEVVEITGRVKGFVKIKTSGGMEGWVPDSAFPGLPPLKDDKDLPLGGLGSVPRTRANAVSRPLVATVNDPAAPVTAPIPPASNGNPPAAPPAPPPSTPGTPTVVVLSTAASAPPPAAATVSVTAAPAAAAAVVAAAKPTTTTSARATSSNSRTASSGSSPKPTGSIATSKPASVKSAAPAPAASNATGSPGTAPSSAPTQPSKPTPPPPNNIKGTESTVNLPPVRQTASLHPVAATTESEDYPDYQPENESDDPACQVYFSAYGLAPSQFKWLAQNRKKKYPGICPAPQPSKVDFVLIFTHDEDVYASSLPVPVHTDKNGFSDFSPLMTVDTAMISESAADKARRDYVWVFSFKRGAFDPGRFSPRRRPQFTKSESKSLGGAATGPRTVEDALRFIEGQGPSH